MQALQHWLSLTALFAACTGGSSPSQLEPAGGYRVLFIGNSLTASNDLPGTLAAMAASAGETIVVESVTRPNFAVIDHVNGMSDASQVIRQGRWDYVVLQQGPTSQQIGRDTLILASQLLDPGIRNAGARAAELMVWPTRENLSTFDGVLQSCVEAAAAVAGVCLPAGEAWRSAWKVDAGLPFYGPDDFHPSPLGTFLAALVIYEGLTGHDARSLPQQAIVAGQRLNVPGAAIVLLQRVAHEAVARYSRSR